MDALITAVSALLASVWAQILASVAGLMLLGQAFFWWDGRMDKKVSNAAADAAKAYGRLEQSLKEAKEAGTREHRKLEAKLDDLEKKVDAMPKNIIDLIRQAKDL